MMLHPMSRFASPHRRVGVLVVAVGLGCTAAPASPDAAPPCEAGVVACEGDVAIDCASGASRRVDCAARGARCVPAVGCATCAPGATDCGDDGLSPRVCAADGQSWRVVSRCDATQGQVCDGRACVAGCDTVRDQPESRGCDFFATQTLNSALGRLAENADRDRLPFTLVVTNPWPSPVHVTVSGGALAAPVRRVLEARGAITVEVPWQASLVDAGDHLRRRSTRSPGGALRITSDAPVTAAQYNPMRPVVEGADDCNLGEACFAYTNDASLLLPVTALGRTYVAVTMPTQRVLSAESTGWSVAPGFLAVVGAHDGTQVTARLRGATMAGDGLAAGSAGGAITFTVNAGEVVQLVSRYDDLCARDEEDRVTRTRFCLPLADEDLTGTWITATQPVAVFSGHDCANVPFDRLACNHLEEQLPPVEALGMRYVVSRAAPVQPPRDPAHPDGEPTAVRVVATEDGTTVRFEPATVHAPVALNRGESVTLFLSEDASVVGDRAILVASMLVGADYFPLDTAVSTQRGDPAMAVEIPVDQYRASYELFAPRDFPQSVVNAVVARDEPVVFDGARITRAPDARLGARDIYRIAVQPGAHRLEGGTPDARLGMKQYGYAPYTAYLLTGGGALRPITVPQ